MKPCPKCKVETERNTKGDCKACVNARSSAWNLANSERVKERNRALYAANPEKFKAKGAAWRSANPEKMKACGKAWLSANSEKFKASRAAYRAVNQKKRNAQSSAWRAENPERMKFLNLAWRAANPKKVIDRMAEWRVNNPEAIRIHTQNRRSRKQANGGVLSQGLSQKLFKLQKGKCPCCKQSLGDDYHLDHVIPLAIGGSHTDDNIQLLRRICNLQKNIKHPVEFMQSRGFLL